LLWLFR
jgi:hypothetical protein